MVRRFDLVAYLKLFRFPLVFTAIADSAAGYLLVQGVPEARVLALLAVASGCLYCFGMAMNDIADRQRDKEIAPNRVLPSGRISLRGAIIACTLTAMISLGAIVLASDASLLGLAVWGAVLTCILAYDLLLKIPPVMGLVRAGNFLLGVHCLDEPMRHGVPLTPEYVLALQAAIVPLTYGTALTFVSTLEEGRVRRWIVYLGVSIMALGAVLPALLHSPWTFHKATWGFIPAGVLVAWTLYRASKATDRKGIMLLVRDGVAGFILLDSAQLAAAGKLIPAAAVAALLIPAALSVAWFKKLA